MRSVLNSHSDVRLIVRNFSYIEKVKHTVHQLGQIQ